MSSHNGVLYISVGDQTHRLTRGSINSLRQYNTVKIAVITDKPELFEDCDWIAEVESISSVFESRRYKTQIGHATPFGKTIFLDADTCVRGNIKNLFDIDGLSLSKSTNQFLGNTSEAIETAAICGGMPRYNTGVIVYNDTHQKLFEAWHNEWLRYGHIDELAFMRALQKNNTPVIELDQKYNSYENDAVIYHAYNQVKYIQPKIV